MKKMPLLLVCLVGAGMAGADTVIHNFDSDSTCSCNPHGGWYGFGAGSVDKGITSSGASGNGVYHTVNWGSSSWGIGEVTTSAVDLSAYNGIRVDAKLDPGTGYSGSARLRFALDLSGGEWTTPYVDLDTEWRTYFFAFSSMTGPGTLDLTAGAPKLIVSKNGQSGSATFYFDTFTGVGSSATALLPVYLNDAPDSDDVRAMWLYPGTLFDDLADLQDVLNFCSKEGVNQIYCGAYSIWTSGTTTQKDNLRKFIATAHDSGIVVEALMGDVDWHQNAAIVRTRISQVLTFQDATTTGDDDFDGIHFDAEFWRHSSWNTNRQGRQNVAKDFLDNVLVNGRDHLDNNGETGMTVGTDLSTHFDISSMLPSQFRWDGNRQFFLEHVLDAADSIVLMSYYDSATAIANVTNAELDLAYGKGRTIILGADIQPTPPEVASNTFADDSPSAYEAMNTELGLFHDNLSASRAAALEGFSVFHYEGWYNNAP